MDGEPAVLVERSVEAIAERLCVQTELVRFPDEFHGLSRSGRTDRRISRLNHIAGWFVKYLEPEA